MNYASIRPVNFAHFAFHRQEISSKKISSVFQCKMRMLDIFFFNSMTAMNQAKENRKRNETERCYDRVLLKVHVIAIM